MNYLFSNLERVKKVVLSRPFGLISDVDNLIKDGWGKVMKITANEQEQTIEVYSESLEKYLGIKSKHSDENDDDNGF